MGVVPLHVYANNLVHRVLRKSKSVQRVLRMSGHCYRGKFTCRWFENQSDGEIERGRRVNAILEPELVIGDALSGDEAVDRAVERQ